MALYTQALVPGIATDAEFRAWGSWISGRLAAAGWVKTADTGQIDWTTVTAAAGVRGYEVWRMADGLQATAPIFMKLEYGATGAVCAIWYTFGAASDGAGNLTGTTTTRKIVDMAGNSATPYTWVISADVNRFLLMACVDGPGAGTGLYLMVERTHDGGGADTAEGLLIASSVGIGSAHSQQFWPHGAAVPGVETSLGVLVPTFGTGTNGTTTATYPLFLSGGPFLNPPLGLLGCFAANFTPGVPISLSIYGAAHTYYPVPSAAYNTVARNAAANTTAFLMRYE